MDIKMSYTCKKLISVTAVMGLIALVAGMFFVDNKLYWTAGIVVGTVVSLVKIYLLEKVLNKAVEMEPKDANNYTRINYTVRLLLSVAVVVGACFIEQINVIGVLIGLLLVQPAAYATNFMCGNKEKVK